MVTNIFTQSIRKFLLSGLIAILFSAPVTMARSLSSYEKCAEKVMNSIKPGYGGSGVGIGDVLEKCGPKPTSNNSRGRKRLLKEDCDWLFEQPLKECSESDDCAGDETTLMSMSSFRGLQELSSEAFRENNFIKLCRQTCKASLIPDRKAFGRTICGE